ncbi:MAG: hypothetical protein ACMXYB_04900 [Candidatus Woesearchaeota archaeon]
MKFKKILKKNTPNNNNKAFLPSPIDVLSMVLLGLVLVISYFYFTSNFSLTEDSFNMQLSDAELFRTSSNIINLAYDTQLWTQTSSRKWAIPEQCRGLIIQDIEEVYFLEKHCSNSNNLYQLVENEAKAQLRGEFREDAYLQRYQSTIRKRLGQCYEFSTVSSDIEIQGYLNMGSSVIPIPRSSSILSRDIFSHLTVCSQRVEEMPIMP